MRIITISCFLIFSILSLIGNEDLSFIIQFHAEKNNSKPSKLILFEEHFENDQNIRDTDIWELCIYANNAWYQYFKELKGSENVKVDDGYLKLRATKDENNYKNAGIGTKRGFPNNTRVEVKARLKSQIRGGFPAIWQMTIGGEDWPRSGEFDIMEWVQGTPNQIYQTVHTFFINGSHGSTGVTNNNPDREFDVTADHVYAVDRTDAAIIFYVDGKETWRYENEYLEDEE